MGFWGQESKQNSQILHPPPPFLHSPCTYNGLALEIKNTLHAIKYVFLTLHLKKIRLGRSHGFANQLFACLIYKMPDANKAKKPNTCAHYCMQYALGIGIYIDTICITSWERESSLHPNSAHYYSSSVWRSVSLSVDVHRIALDLRWVWSCDLGKNISYIIIIMIC